MKEKNIKENIREITNTLIEHEGRGGKDIKTALVISRDGLLIYQTGKLVNEQVIAMMATLYGAAETASIELRVVPKKVVVETIIANLVVMSAGPKMLLAFVAGLGKNLDFVTSDEITRAIQKIAQLTEKNE